MTIVAFERADWHLVAKDSCSCICLGDIASFSCSSVRVDVANIRSLKFRISQRQLHRLLHAMRIGLSNVSSIAICSVTNKLGIDACAAGFGMLVVLKNQSAGTLT
ncbi:hypothetical protein D3C72_1467270 [compost metagenome]